ncbi:hypothetical protein [Paenibacillus sp. RC84]|uniref:hypothetical protein n=1 Tax=Paenibacillus sp. RC84 TaxID=3156252 RepID=UPI003515659E
MKGRHWKNKKTASSAEAVSGDPLSEKKQNRHKQYKQNEYNQHVQVHSRFSFKRDFEHGTFRNTPLYASSGVNDCSEGEGRSACFIKKGGFPPAQTHKRT